MSEFILHYIWQFKLFAMQELRTTTGQRVEVIDVGISNSDSGPDFFNAKIKIDDTLWVGNVEIHNRSSDWKRHKHHLDKAYDSVVLHITGMADCDVFRTNGEEVPQLVLQIPEYIAQNYAHLSTEKRWIYCEDKIADLPPFIMSSWKQALLVERLERKAEDIQRLLEQSNNHWEEAFYVSLARSFGFGVNSQAFELTAKSLPLNILAKHKDNLMQLEALLFGQAGFLTEEATDDYHATLMNEYLFLRKKYNLTPLDKVQWKMLRLRPDNFPHVRLAQFAALTHRSNKLFSKMEKSEDVKSLRQLFKCDVSLYWQSHYRFGTESKTSKKQLGTHSVDSILINTVVPFLFAVDKAQGNDSERSIRLLESIPPENNSIIKNWIQLGQPVESAFDSQALLQLKTNYCDEKKCLQCRIGHKLLSSKEKK